MSGSRPPRQSHRALPQVPPTGDAHNDRKADRLGSSLSGGSSEPPESRAPPKSAPAAPQARARAQGAGNTAELTADAAASSQVNSGSGEVYVSGIIELVDKHFTRAEKDPAAGLRVWLLLAGVVACFVAAVLGVAVAAVGFVVLVGSMQDTISQNSCPLVATLLTGVVAGSLAVAIRRRRPPRPGQP